MPSRSVALHVTDKRLFLVRTVLSRYLLLGVPILLLISFFIARWIGVGGVLAAVVLLSALGPRRLVKAHALGELTNYMVQKPDGALSWFEREVVQIAFKDGDVWRLSAGGRGERSAASIIDALASAGVRTAER